MNTLKTFLYQDIKRGNFEFSNLVKRRWAKKLGKIPRNSAVLEVYRKLLEEGKIKKNKSLEKSLKIRKVRTLSGVAPFAVMMKPYPCPGNCIYCVEEKGMPKSYMSDEPAASRAKKLNFNPQKQILSRLEQFRLTGHDPEKLEIIIIGATFSAYPDEYKKNFIKAIFDTCNNAESLLNNNEIVKPYNSETIQQSQKINETAKYRIIGLSVETRPDWITEKEIKLLREYGVTRIQMGVQALDDGILRKINRGHNLDAVAKATELLRNAGFKINYHFMPNLPGSTPQKDYKMAKLMFEDERFKPDTLKIYPCIVLPNTPLEKLYKLGKYKSYDDEKLKNLLIKIKLITPKYCRIDRLVRDITKNWTISGTKTTNMRQLIAQQMKKDGLVCNCIRCREIKSNQLLTDIVKFKKIKYKSNNGWEYLLTYETEDNKLYAMLRLRLPFQHDLSNDRNEYLYINNETMKQCNNVVFSILKNSAIIREIHVFGQQIGINKKEKNASQHTGYGKKLIKKAEIIAKKNGYKKIAIISGVGVREYYRKLGYKLKQTYMVKTLD